MSPFCEALRSLRTRQGLRQHELAELAKCDRSYLSAVETGLKPVPSADFVETLVRVLALQDAEAHELRSAWLRSRRTYSVARESPVEIYDFVYDLFERLDRLGAKQLRALKAVLDMSDGQPATPARWKSVNAADRQVRHVRTNTTPNQEEEAM